MSRACWEDPASGAPKELRDWLAKVVVRSATMAEHARRMTITPNDVVLVLKQMGRCVAWCQQRLLACLLAIKGLCCRPAALLLCAKLGLLPAKRVRLCVWACRLRCQRQSVCSRPLPHRRQP